jgi:hypothetical protein
MTAKLDSDFGIPRSPGGALPIANWERKNGVTVRPLSVTTFDARTGQHLVALQTIANTTFFGTAIASINYLWAIAVDGSLVVAVEELAVEDAVSAAGLPRRRSGQHPAETKKLGHPTLVNCGQARIAGELALDNTASGFAWVLNANSGRYCSVITPKRSHLLNVQQMLAGFGLTVRIDDQDTVA